MDKFIRFAKNVWDVSAEGRTPDAIALAGIQALERFIKKIGLPTTLRELGVADKGILPAIAQSCNIASGSYGDMIKEAILEILNTCWHCKVNMKK